MEYTERELANEEWRDVIGYEGKYQVSCLGRVRSVERLIKTNRFNITKLVKGRIMKLKLRREGYLEVNLWLEGKYKTHKVHRLVAMAFIANPNNYKEINHKDENKANNHIDNIEWCTSKYNVNYGSRNKRCALSKYKAVVQLNIVGEVIARHVSLTVAGVSVGGNAQGVFLCVKGKINTYKGFIWKYESINE